jgi:mannose-6-phosphate isomerase
MKRKLYPLAFTPILQEKVWGSETWGIASLDEGADSVVENGFLADNTLSDLLETYLGNLVGDNVFDAFNLQFPLLIKVLNVNQTLSVQVHPDDAVAAERYDQYGKDECWYVMDAKPTARVYMGFKRDTSAAEFYQKCKDGTVEELLNVYTPKAGEFFHIPAGTVHACGGGLTIAEVQESSDMTFRLYDWGRENNPATARKMHLDEAIDCIDYRRYDEARLHIADARKADLLAENPHFTIRRIALTKPATLDMDRYNSCIFYICLEGSAILTSDGSPENCALARGGFALVPWGVGEATITPGASGVTLLQATIPPIPEEEDEYINPDAAATLPDDKEDA